eukprot:m.188401 g.188401  ORF g.188401 m.188401 type:complete len:443 (+) comp21648_c0_seq1:119-1447(+)
MWLPLALCVCTLSLTAATQSCETARVGLNTEGRLVLADCENATTLGDMLERLQVLEQQGESLVTIQQTLAEEQAVTRRLRNRINALPASANVATFDTQYLTPIGLTFAAADMDGDNHTDLIIKRSTEISVILNVHSSTASTTDFQNFDFDHPVIVATDAVGARQIIVADIDGDGALDVVSATFSANEVGWYRNSGAVGAPLSFVRMPPVSSNFSSATGVTAADFDLDGDLDVAACSFFESRLAWFRNDNGSFVEVAELPTRYSARVILSADVDSDGDWDIVGDSFFWRNEGNGTFFPIEVFPDGTSKLAVGDVDQDGRNDIIRTTIGNGAPDSWARQTADGSFTVTDFDAGYTVGLCVDDLNNDGYPELVTTSSSRGTLAYFSNAHNGSWVISPPLAGPLVCTADCRLLCGDFDRDGDVDILATNIDRGVLHLYIYRNELIL